ncbi:copper oxidase [Embleya scabrispora]|uniref:Multicopper oxidase CueO n=1 Tax=Embleya scabrispora TaxID=159449 RepID=A0A1T3NNP4_9ACTN|nr:multicopper oxidase domain-containing protein [Embleya scabrispora]OPC78454.1 copper oxidase [Embleya scabrispora]
MSDPTRRTVLRGLAAVPVAAAAAGCSTTESDHRPSFASAPPAGKRPLPIPPLAKSTVTDDGTRRFDLDIRAGTTQIVAGVTTPTWGYSGAILGPTLRAKHGETVAVRVRNSLGEVTSVHWHGMHLPAIFDGGPHQPIMPGGTWTPTWTVKQPAATLWYHPHAHGTTQRHAFRGLAGLFIIDDDDPVSRELPHDYGVDDVPLIVQDKKFTPNGNLDERDDPSAGLLGSTVTTNGIADTYLNVTTERVRLRVLNGSTVRFYNLGFDDDSEFEMIACDGGLLEAPARLRRLRLTPGERAEIIVTMRPGLTRVLRAYPFEDDNGIQRSQPAANFGLADTFDIVLLRAANTLKPRPAPPTALAHIPPIDTNGAATRTFLFGQVSINGATMDMQRIDVQTVVDTPEIWAVTNGVNGVHNFHVHDTRFRVIDIDGQAPPPELAGWKDTVNVRPFSTVRLAVRFSDYTDARWPYMYHCHLMYHEDYGMMGQFLVLRPGEKPDSVIGQGGGGPHHEHGAPPR